MLIRRFSFLYSYTSLKITGDKFFLFHASHSRKLLYLFRSCFSLLVETRSRLVELLKLSSTQKQGWKKKLLIYMLHAYHYCILCCRQFQELPGVGTRASATIL